MCTQLVTPAKERHAAPASFRSDADVYRLVRLFHAGTLPREQWTHAAHLAVAVYHARRYAPAEGLRRLREAIKRYNKRTGTPETPTRGYHETITVAWFHLVLHFLEVFEDVRSLAALAEAVAVVYARDELFRHYGRERLLGAEARARFVEPDLRPLPALAPFTQKDREWLNRLGKQPLNALAVSAA